MKCLRMLVVVGGCLLASGCAVHGLYEDQDRIRTTLLELYTNQILDNLVRAECGQPIVQLDYANATAQLTIKDTAGLSDMLASSNPGVLKTVAGSTATVLKTTLNTAIGSVGVDRANQVSLTATPVTVGDDVYDAYREFLAIPGSFQVTCDPPPCGAAHLCKRCGSKYCWVPVAYKRAFLQLALTTTAQRGQPIAALDAFYAVNIIAVESADKIGSDTEVLLTVKLDKKIPTDTGRIEISINDAPSAATPPKTDGKTDKKTEAKTEAKAEAKADGKTTGQGSGDGASKSKTLVFKISDVQPSNAKHLEQSDVIRIYYNVAAGKAAGFADYDLFVNRISTQSLSAKVYLTRHRPQVPVVNDVFNRIEFSLQQIQFNQTRTGIGP